MAHDTSDIPLTCHKCVRQSNLEELGTSLHTSLCVLCVEIESPQAQDHEVRLSLCLA